MADHFASLRDSIDRLGIRMGQSLPSAPLQQYYRRQEAADYLRLGQRKFDELSLRGHIKRANVDGVLIFRREDLDAFVEEQLEMNAAQARNHARRRL